MINITASLIEEDDMLQQIQAVIGELTNTEVLVGIPEEEADRESGEITNAALMYIHTNGSPLNNIPARPVIEPAISDAKEQIGAIMGEAARSALDGNKAGMMMSLEKAGLAGQRAAQAWFTNPLNAWAPNTEETAAAKRRKGSTDPKPLIDTGELRRAITYVVEDRTSKGGKA